jgi:REP element-mobilizing transposase RayT
MPHEFQISHDSQALYITLNTYHRLPVFRTDALKTVICNAIAEARQSAGFLLFAYVIMLDHVHLITDQPKPISEVLRIIKGVTAHRVINYLKENNHLVSLAKLQHQVASVTIVTHPGKESGMSFRYSAKDCLCRRSITFTTIQFARDLSNRLLIITG